MLFFSLTNGYSIQIPSFYHCKAVRLSQEKNGQIYAKGYQVKSLYIKITANNIAVFGTHGNYRVCRKLSIRRVIVDTLFLDDPDIPLAHSELKLYLCNDTLMGNVNLFENDSSRVTIKVLVEKLSTHTETELEKKCR